MQQPIELKARLDPPGRTVVERGYRSWPGIPVLIVSLAAFTAAILLLRGSGTARIWTGIGLLVLAALGFAGLSAITPGQVRVVQLFGGYRGTVRTSGLRWVNPFAVRRKVSGRKVNRSVSETIPAGCSACGQQR